MRTVWSVTLLMVGITLAGCASEEGLQSFDAVEAPDWKPGYAFSYDTMGEARSRALVLIDGQPEVNENETIQVPRQASHSIQILNTSFEAPEPVYVGAMRLAQQELSITADHSLSVLGRLPVAMRQRDLGDMSITMQQSEDCEFGCRLRTTSIEVQNGSGPDPFLDFPLEKGKSWTSTFPTGLSAEDGLPTEFTVTSRAVGSETVDGPDGPVDAVRIVHQLDAQLDPVVQAAVESGQAGDVELDFQAGGTITMWYAPALQAIVKEHVAIEVLFDLDGTIEGSRVEAHLVAQLDTTNILTGIDLEEEAERDMQGLYDFFDGVEPIKDPSGNVSEAAYSVQIVADDAEFDVGDGKTVSFAVELSGTLPDSHHLVYTVAAADGTVVTDGAGDAFEAEFKDPGVYQAAVRAVNGDGFLQTQDAMLIVADHRASHDVSCSTVILPVSGSCQSVTIPVLSDVGLQELRIDVAADAAASEGGTLTLRDGAGNEVTSDGTITLADVDGLVVDGSPWQATWSRDASVLEDTTIDVVLDYGPDSPDATVEPEPVSVEWFGAVWERTALSLLG